MGSEGWGQVLRCALPPRCTTQDLTPAVDPSGDTAHQGFRAKGALYKNPGQRPGYQVTPPNQALKGRPTPSFPRPAPPSPRLQTKHRATCPMNGTGGVEQRVGSPFQGLGVLFVAVPGRCPGLVWSAPLGLFWNRKKSSQRSGFRGVAKGEPSTTLGPLAQTLGPCFGTESPADLRADPLWIRLIALTYPRLRCGDACSGTRLSAPRPVWPRPHRSVASCCC